MIPAKFIWDSIEWFMDKIIKKQKKILIVEDNDDDAYFLINLLKDKNLTATRAHNADEAKALISRNKLGLIFVDMRLRGMDGWDLVPLIWKNSSQSIIVILCGEFHDIPKIKIGKDTQDTGMVVIKKPMTEAKLDWLLKGIKI